MTEIQSGPVVSPLRDLLQSAATVLVALSTASFVAGLLIVNLHLAKYGVHALEIDRAEYVLVGACFMFLVFGGYFSCALGRNVVLSAIDDWKKGRRGKAAWSVGEVWLGLLAVVYVLDRITGPEIRFSDWREWLSLVVLGFTGSCARICAQTAYRFWKEYRAFFAAASSPDQEIVNRREVQLHLTRRGTDLVNLLGAGPALLAAYAWIVYPMISVAYGGGYREPVYLITTGPGGAVAKSLHLPIDSTGRVGPLYLITESDKELVATVSLYKLTIKTAFDRPHAFRIKRDLVDAIDEETDSTPATVSPKNGGARAPATNSSAPTKGLPTASVPLASAPGNAK